MFALDRRFESGCPREPRSAADYSFVVFRLDYDDDEEEDDEDADDDLDDLDGIDRDSDDEEEDEDDWDEDAGEEWQVSGSGTRL